MQIKVSLKNTIKAILYQIFLISLIYQQLRVIILLTIIMNFISSLQKEYQQLWKYIIRPTRVPYDQSKLGPSLFVYQGVRVQRKDFCLTNSRGLQFSCSLWLPIMSERSNCVIYLHGNSSNRLQGYQYLGNLVTEGIGLCTFDFSGCGNAEGQYVSLGFYQQQDLKTVIQHLKIYPRIDKLALWGRSMGAVTAFLYLPKDNFVSAVIFDSPFKSFKGLVQDMANKTSKIPGIILKTALKIINRTIQQKANFSIFDIDPLKFGSPNIFIPAFFLVGIQDEIIPIEHTGELFEAYGGEDKTIKMVNGGHNDNRPDLTTDLIIQFLKLKFQEENVTKSLKQKQQINIKQHGKMEQIQYNIKVEQKQTISPLKSSEIQKVEQAVKKGDFSWSNLFSGFSKSSKESEKQQKKKEEIKPISNRQNPDIKKQNAQNNTKKVKKEKPKPDRSKYQASVQQKVRQYSFCYF